MERAIGASRKYSLATGLIIERDAGTTNTYELLGLHIKFHPFFFKVTLFFDYNSVKSMVRKAVAGVKEGSHGASQ